MLVYADVRENTKPRYFCIHHRLKAGRKNPMRFYSGVTFLFTVFVAMLISTAGLIAAPSAYNLLDAKERGTTAMGDAKGTLTPSYDEAVKKDVLEFKYSLTQGSAICVWSRNFPSELTSDSVKGVKIGVKTAEQAAQILVTAQIKGTGGVQEIPLRFRAGWNTIQESLDWEAVGNFEEVGFIITIDPKLGKNAVKGTISFLLDFVPQQAAAREVTPKAEEILQTKQETPVREEPVQKAAVEVMRDQAPTPVPEVSSRTFFSLLDAGDKGVVTDGQAKGSITFSFDEEVRKDVYDLGYLLPEGGSITVWTKEFPSDLNEAQVNTIQIGLRALSAAQLNRTSIKAELKGTKGSQIIPIRLKPGWNAIQKSVQWAKIGKLTEVHFVIRPKGKGSSASEILYLGFEFSKSSFVKEHQLLIKFGFVFLFGLLSFLIAGLFSKPLNKGEAAEPLGDDAGETPSGEVTLFSRLRQDFFYGLIVVMIIGSALWIYSLGTFEIFNMGMIINILAVALLGGGIAELLKFKFTGKHLTPDQILQNVLLSGILAASSSKLQILQAPSAFGQLAMLCKMTAAVTFVLYHIFNAASLSSSGKHLRAINGVLIVGTPYLFGCLLLLENVTLLQTLAFMVSGGILAAWPTILEDFGRLLIVFGFNEILTNGIGLLTKGRLLKTTKAHLIIFLISLGVVVAPSIANLASIAAIAGLPAFLRAIVSVLLTMLSFAGLWGEVYLLTGVLLDSGKRVAPSEESLWSHSTIGMRKGFAFSGILMSLLYIFSFMFATSAAQKIMASSPYGIGILLGALLFPLVKTIIETFDGSLPFFDRMRYSYSQWTLYIRGAIAGFGFAYMIAHGMFDKQMSERVAFGLKVGLAASVGVSFLRDIIYAIKGQGKIQSWRLYLIDSALGIFLGSAIAFYLDTPQVAVVLNKFKLYITSHFSATDIASHSGYLNSLGQYTQPVLISKWGQMNLGHCPGGVKLLFTESLDGVIKWAVATWLFAVNKVFMQAFFDKDKTPIKFFFSKAGLAQLTELMIYVLRWGLWMSPIIFTFLRMMPTATWYNQDGAIRTFFAIWNNATMTPDAFQAWSVQIFLWVMAFDFFRILIWMDHMGLRVATLVNLSFLGMDKLDEKVAKFIGPAVAQRYIPEGVKRFLTWAPLLIPFYIPRGEQWDYVWSKSESMQNAMRGKGLIPTLQHLSLGQLVLVIVAAILVSTVFVHFIRRIRYRARKRRIKTYEMSNRDYKITLKENGEIFSEVITKECDVTRRSYDIIDPCGRVLFLVDVAEKPGSVTRAWPVIGNFPTALFEASKISRDEDSFKVSNINHGVKTTIEIGLPDQDSTAEIWKIHVQNLTDRPRQLKIVPYLEWVLNGGLHDRFHTQYQRLYPEMEYIRNANAMLSWQKATKSMGILAADTAPEGFLRGRVDFIGRARSLWSPRVLETLDFLEAKDTPACPTFDPIGSLLIDVVLEPKASKTVKMMIGFAKKKEQALDLIQRHLKPQPPTSASLPAKHRHLFLIGHGEIPAGTPQPYFEFLNNGNKLFVRTPYTPRPFDHALSNPVHSVMVTNRGLHTSCNGNSQQNRLTPDWPDTVTKEIPSEAIFLYDPERKEWFSPTHHPLNDPNAKNESEFSVDGTAIFRMTCGTLSTELTVFVPTDDPTGVYFLTLKNSEDRPRKMRIAPYFQMTLAFMPERSGPLGVKYDKVLDALFFENPRNMFRAGPAFASMSVPAECVETKRGKFFGSGRGVTRPFMVEYGQADHTQLTDNMQIAGFLGTVEIPARGECSIAIVMGQTDDRKQALQIVQKYKNIETVRKTLEETRKWWLSLMATTEIKTTEPAFDRYQNWLKYQALAERIWARRGFYQTSGAYGFRDQLQDTVNLTWIDPALARKQVLLHASQQFLEGDVFHWFFTLTDGRSAFSCRSHASDNLLWLVWGVVEYIRIAGDDSILDEQTSYVASEFPFAPLPKNKHGWGSLYQRSTRADTVYRHCLRSIDVVLNKRMGRNGLPLMGTGDWNDGLDEIGSAGKGESVWLGFFLYYILKEMADIIEDKEGIRRKEYYLNKMQALEAALERTWRGDRYLRAIHDDGTEIGTKDSGVWEIDALTAAWAVKTGINFERGLTIFNTALSVLERGNVILLGWPALREDTKPYLGRSSKYPEGVRENGMYCHGVQWLVRAARILSEQFEERGDHAKADEYRAIAYRLWLKITPIAHVTPQEIEIYGGQPNKQPADFLTTFEPGRMIWNGYTGAAGWMLRQAFEGVIGALVVNNKLVLPADLDKPRGALRVVRVYRDVTKSPLKVTSD